MYNITMILAKDKNNLVGKCDGRFGLAWHYPSDLKFYQANTTGKINVMGRNTFELIGKALPNRETYVLTTNQNYQVENANVVTQIEEVLEMSKSQEIMICGGVSVYQSFNKYANKIILTIIDAEHDGDVYYQNLNLDNFKKIMSTKEGILDFQIWERNEN